MFYTHIQWCFETIFSVAFFSARLPLPASHFVPQSVCAHRNSGWSSQRTVPGDTLSTRFTVLCRPVGLLHLLTIVLPCFCCCRASINIEILTWNKPLQNLCAFQVIHKLNTSGYQSLKEKMAYCSLKSHHHGLPVSTPGYCLNGNQSSDFYMERIFYCFWILHKEFSSLSALLKLCCSFCNCCFLLLYNCVLVSASDWF